MSTNLDEIKEQLENNHDELLCLYGVLYDISHYIREGILPGLGNNTSSCNCKCDDEGNDLKVHYLRKENRKLEKENQYLKEQLVELYLEKKELDNLKNWFDENKRSFTKH